MNLQSSDPSPSAISSATKGVSDLLSSFSGAGPWGASELESNPSQSDLALAAPHKVFVMTTENLLENAGLEASQDVGWRFFVTQGSAVVGAAETYFDEATNENQFASLAQDPQTVRSANMLVELEARPWDNTNEFEIRLLRVPELYSVSIWLHSDEVELLVPVDAPQTPLESGHIYDPESVLASLHDLAEETRGGAASTR